MTTTIPTSAVDALLTAQFAIAWAGERGESPRLGWWRTDLVSEFGGEDLFQQLLPDTWRWAVLQAAREAARRHDQAAREASADGDQIISLFRLGPELDERVEERLADLKRSGATPTEALPGLADVQHEAWSRADFEAWLEGHDPAKFTITPTGRRLTGDAPAGVDHLTHKLVAAFLPLTDDYPLPHFRRDG